VTEYIDLDASNVDDHHLCCALGDRKHEEGVFRKREWLKRRFREGLVFRKLDVRGKVFIEYAPAEVAWRPIVAPGWMVVHCLWVSGRFAKQGHGRRLLQSCLDDAAAQDKHGVVLAAADRKRPFLSDPKFLKHLGFEEVDRAGVFRLYARRVSSGERATAPRFAPAVRHAPTDDGPLVMRHTDQCPFNAHWAEEMASHARTLGYDVSVERITRRRQAQGVASPLGTFGMERGGGLILHHLATNAALERTFR